MGLRGPGAYPWSARFPSAPKTHVTHTLTCWACRKRFTARRIDATYCSSECKKQNLLGSERRADKSDSTGR